MKNKDLIVKEMEKRDEIVNTFDKNYLLEAGAGAGKTTIIVQRIINHIVNSDIDPSNLVAITFTKAAATELAERVQLKALERLKAEKDPKIIEKLKNIDKIFTGTIHSFGDLILREMPFHADLSPGYEILEDDTEFNTNVWYSFLRDREEDYKDAMETLDKFNIDYMDLRTRAILALSNLDVNFTGYDGDKHSYKDLEREFESIKNTYGDLEFKDISKGKAIGKLLYGILEEDGKLEDYSNIFNNAFLGKDFHVDEYFLDIHKKTSVFEDEDRYKEMIDELYNLYEKLRTLPYDTCTDFINMVVDYKNKNYKGKLTFNELLYKASSLVKTSEEARLHLKNKYKYFYLDESQDTDPMQIELIMHLVDKDSKYSGKKAWHDVDPIPGSLFIVGDPKQSIYRFRRADISIYNQLKDLIDKNGEVVYLDINFRSSDKICHWVQSTFKKRDDEIFGFPEESTDAQAGFKRILSQWDDSPGEEDQVENFLQGVYKYNYGPGDEEYVGDLVVELLDKYIVTKEQNSKGEYYNHSRKVEHGDIMILTKANAETGLYLKSLKDRGIPALLGGEKVLGDTREVSNLFVLIDALVDYRDNIKIVSALRNCFYLDLETIDLFMEEKTSLSKFMFFPKEIEEIQHPSIKNAFSYINKIMTLSKELSPMAFVERLVENKLGIYEVNKDYDPLELRDGDSSLRQAIEILKTKECYSIYRLREELKTLVFNEIKYELPINREEANNALRIMNIHKAKGLEANIILLVGGDKARYISSDTHYIQKNQDDMSIGYMKYNSQFKAKGPGEDEKQEKEMEFKEAEMDRLLYVAATRAKSVLIIAEGINEEAFLNPLSTNIDKEISVIEEREKIDNILKPTGAKQMERRLTRDLRIKKEIYSPAYIRSSPSSFKASGFGLDEKQSMDVKSVKVKFAKKIKAPDKIKFNPSPRGRVYGTIVHDALESLIKGTDNLQNISKEKINYSIKFAVNGVIDNLEINKTNISLLYPGQYEKVKKLVRLSIKEGREVVVASIKERLYAYVKDVLHNFMENQDIKELFKNADQVFPELAFTIAIHESNKDIFEKISTLMATSNTDEISRVERDNKTILINGVIDLVVKSKDNTWTILDYKSDKPLREGSDIRHHLIKSYGGQLEGYKLLFEEIVKDQEIKVDKLLLYSTYLDGVIEVNSEVMEVNSDVTEVKDQINKQIR